MWLRNLVRAGVCLRTQGSAVRRGGILLSQAAENQVYSHITPQAVQKAPSTLFFPFALAQRLAMTTTSPTTSPTSDPTTGTEVQKKTERIIVFVLGGPGSGKGTQCAKLVEEFGIVHLSAGDLLRAHMKSGTEDGNMVAEMIKQGTIVPSHVTNSLLEKAMDESKQEKFLIDGFPRNEENRASFEKQTGQLPFFILFFDCPEDVMEKRLLGRGTGRTDDNIETIRKRFKVFKESSMPIVDHYDKQGKVYKFDSTKTPDQIYSQVRELFLDL